MIGLLFPTAAQAAFLPPPAEVGTWTTFQPWRDEYRTDFGMPPPTMWDTLRLYFETPLGTPYQADYTPAQVQSRIMYLTCNGTYQLQYLQGGVYVAWSGLIETTEIINPTCMSYPQGGAADDLTASYTDGPGSDYTVHWDGMPGADSYDVYEDGVWIGTVPAGSGGPYDYVTAGGSVSIVARDGSGDVIGHSDIQVPEFGGWEDGSGCGVCDKLGELLACPGWDDVLGDLQQILTDAIGDALHDFFGPVPDPPTMADVDEMIRPDDLPDLDLDFPGDDLVPVVPDDYDNGPLDFDITDGPQIDVVDESEPFIILEPDAYLDYDDPGVMVFPGDPRNDSGGIKDPDEWDSPYPMPTPQPTPTPSPTPSPGPTPPPEPTIPPAVMPTPGYVGGNTPIPGEGPGEGGEE